MPSELEYKRHVRKTCGLWSEAYEPGKGSGFGYPDLQLLVNRVLLPVELKTGTLGSGRLWPSEVRPAQVRWHHDFARAGGTAVILVCVGPVREMSAWVLPSADRRVTSAWREGYALCDCPQWYSRGKLIASL